MIVRAIPSRECTQPRDFALLLLASGDLRPRQRARDQLADLAGMEIKRRILERLVEADPEPEELELVLMEIVDEIGPPSGPTRAVAAVIRDEWQAASAAPEWVSQLLSDAVNLSRDRQKSPTGADREKGD
jgi:hypothetical protein